ncbi:MAG: gamma-glutamyltransferase [Clostridiales bacterium]|nr:gamma-glutamyltransferase [Clostridiales bacterium]
MNNDPSIYPYHSKRMVTYGKRGMVATSQQQAAQAGLDIIKQGGNAIDAAVATAACLTVLEPTCNGIGSDCFALIWFEGKLHGLNASGKSPKSITIDKVKALGHDAMPAFGLTPVTVPGTPGGWAEMISKFGKLSLSEVLAPAIDYAQNGYPVSPVVAASWKKAHEKYKENFIGDEFQSWFDTFAPKGKAPNEGEMVYLKDHARSLREIAKTNAQSFYQGAIADKIDAFSKQYGGFISKQDLQDFKPLWVMPISVKYRGYDVWEIPPNGQGLVALMALNILKQYEFSSKETVNTYHKQIEAMKLAFVDGKKYITDSLHMKESVEMLLSPKYANMRKNVICNDAIMPTSGTPPKGGTVYLATADGDGNMVSFIQSNYMGFGSGIVIPGTGIALQNRGHSFSLDEMHYNKLAPGKRTYHTIIPGFLTKDNKAIGPFGVMGGFMQPQGHVQVIMNMLDFKLNPQSALDAPRWQWMEDKKIIAEKETPINIIDGLKAKGHDIRYEANSNAFGHGQIIIRDEEGVLIGGTEPRTDSAVAAW